MKEQEALASSFVCHCAVKPVVPSCSVPEAVPVGTSAELRCLENEGFPPPQYRWFYNEQEMPLDPKTSLKFLNSSYSINRQTGHLVRNTEVERMNEQKEEKEAADAPAEMF